MFKISLADSITGFSPGQNIAGKLEWIDLDQDITKVDLRLIWYTTGKGDQDFGIVKSRPEFRPSTSGCMEFSFPCPLRPYSFAGKLIKLHWALEAISFPDQNAERLQISVSPTTDIIQLYA